jgi:hypothetical protein
MLRPAAIDIEADRWVACIRELPIVGADLTGAELAMHVRLIPDATGDPLVSLGTVSTSTAQGLRVAYAGTDTVNNHIAAGRLREAPSGLAGADAVAVTVLGIRVNETTMEGLPFPDERGDTVTLAYDIHITPAGGTKDKYAGGSFIVRPGATQ